MCLDVWCLVVVWLLGRGIWWPAVDGGGVVGGGGGGGGGGGTALLCCLPLTIGFGT